MSQLFRKSLKGYFLDEDHYMQSRFRPYQLASSRVRAIQNKVEQELLGETDQAKVEVELFKNYLKPREKFSKFPNSSLDDEMFMRIKKMDAYRANKLKKLPNIKIYRQLVRKEKMKNRSVYPSKRKIKSFILGQRCQQCKQYDCCCEYTNESFIQELNQQRDEILSKKSKTQEIQTFVTQEHKPKFNPKILKGILKMRQKAKIEQRSSKKSISPTVELQIHSTKPEPKRRKLLIKSSLISSMFIPQIKMNQDNWEDNKSKYHITETTLQILQSYSQTNFHTGLNQQSKIQLKERVYYEFGGIVVYDSQAEMCYERFIDTINKDYIEKGVIYNKDVQENIENAKFTDKETYLNLGKVGNFRKYERKYFLSIPQYAQTLQFESRFESGNLHKAVNMLDNKYFLILEQDTEQMKTTQWYYFAVKTQIKHTVTFSILNFVKYDSLYNQGMKPLVFSQKQKEKTGIGWHRAGTDISYKRTESNSQNNLRGGLMSLDFTYTFEHQEDIVWFAYSYPFTYKDQQEYCEQLTANYSQILRVNPICVSLGGNVCNMITITQDIQTFTSFSDEILQWNTSAAGRRMQRAKEQRQLSQEQQKHFQKKGIVLTARVHPGETVSSFLIQGAINFLTGNSRIARILRRNYVFKIVPMLNPDGVRHGFYRTSLLGCDLNRRWNNPSKYLHPTIYYTKKMIETFNERHELIMFCDMHGHSLKRNVFMYGCAKRTTDFIEKRKFLLAKVIPSLLNQRNYLFSFNDTRFRYEKGKINTARIVINKEFQVINSYTMEASFYGPLKAKALGRVKGSDLHMNQRHLQSVGEDLCRQCVYFISRRALWQKIVFTTEFLQGKHIRKMKKVKLKHYKSVRQIRTRKIQRCNSLPLKPPQQEVKQVKQQAKEEKIEELVENNALILDLKQWDDLQIPSESEDDGTSTDSCPSEDDYKQPPQPLIQQQIIKASSTQRARVKKRVINLKKIVKHEKNKSSESSPQKLQERRNLIQSQKTSVSAGNGPRMCQKAHSPAQALKRTKIFSHNLQLSSPNQKLQRQAQQLLNNTQLYPENYPILTPNHIFPKFQRPPRTNSRFMQQNRRPQRLQKDVQQASGPYLSDLMKSPIRLSSLANQEITPGHRQNSLKPYIRYTKRFQFICAISFKMGCCNLRNFDNQEISKQMQDDEPIRNQEIVGDLQEERLIIEKSLSYSSILNMTIIQQQSSEAIYNSLDSLLLGQTIEQFAEKYSIISLIGEGQYGKVYKVLSINHQKVYAAKIISKEVISLNALKRIYKEIEMLIKINQPNVLKIQDVFEDDKTVIEVFDYYSGNTLDQFLSKKESISELLAVQIFFQIIKALNYLNDLDLVHRDIKPENILFQQQMGSLPIILIDFGSFQSIQKGQKLSKPIGSPLYMAPDVKIGFYGKKCDVWSAGVILYELLGKFHSAGFNPFNSFTLQDVYQKILYKKINFIALKQRNISKRTIKLLQTVLNRNAQQRPSSKRLWKSRNAYLIRQLKERYIDRQLWFSNIKKSKIQKLLLAYIAKRIIPNEQLCTIRQSFIELDLDNDGLIQGQDFTNSFTNYLKICDAQQQKSISYNQYLLYNINWEDVLTNEIVQIAYNLLIAQDGIFEILAQYFYQNGGNNQDQINQKFQIYYNKISALSQREFRRFLMLNPDK